MLLKVYQLFKLILPFRNVVSVNRVEHYYGTHKVFISPTDAKREETTEFCNQEQIINFIPTLRVWYN